MASAYNTSSAYDLSAYEQVRPIRPQAQRAQLKVVRSPKQFLASAVTPKSVCVFLISVTVVCLMVYNYVCLNEVTGQISELNTELTTLQSNHVKLQSQLGSAMSPRAVAELAENQLGLKRLDKYQTEYIYLYHEDKIEVMESAVETDLNAKAKHVFNSAVHTIKEYIAGR